MLALPVASAALGIFSECPDALRRWLLFPIACLLVSGSQPVQLLHASFLLLRYWRVYRHLRRLLPCWHCTLW